MSKRTFTQEFAVEKTYLNYIKFKNLNNRHYSTFPLHFFFFLFKINKIQ